MAVIKPLDESELDELQHRERVRACPAKGCYEPMGHSGNVHGIIFPTRQNRAQRRGNPVRGKQRRR